MKANFHEGQFQAGHKRLTGCTRVHTRAVCRILHTAVLSTVLVELPGPDRETRQR
jgi:hypothetical protein